jgi:hypothetical protein
VPSPEEQARRRERWIDIIRRRVDDPKLKLCVCVKVASAITAGELKESHVDELLAELDQRRRDRTLRAEPGAYFVGGVKRLFARAGIEWQGYAKKPK